MTTPTDRPLVNVTFWGAARTVTGSMHLVEAAGHKVLLDCGLFQGRRAEAERRNRTFPFPPKKIDAVVLSHAHIDHCGNLPNLVRQGFKGPIYCTPATRDLLAVMLADSAKIQEEDARYLNKRRPSGEPRVEPLYDRTDAHRTAGLCQSVPYDTPFAVGRGFQATFVDAGHLLGSAMVAVRVKDRGREATLTFTGDLGRPNLPILRDPSPVPPGDLLISESTYGGRTHEPVEDLADKLAVAVKRAFDRGGKVLIPAFSLGRTQTVVYDLHRLMSDGRLPEVPIFVDSPLAANATEIFRLHPECFDEETAQLLEDVPDLFGERRVAYVRQAEDSMRLNARREPCVIIAASGMCEAGRILHHLKHNVADPRTMILIVGFQAPHTLGRRLVDRLPEVKVFDRVYPLKAEVVVLNGFSSHAGQPDFMALLGPLASTVKKVRLVHGEPDRAEILAQSLRQVGFTDVAIPDRGESVTPD